METCAQIKCFKEKKRMLILLGNTCTGGPRIAGSMNNLTVDAGQMVLNIMITMIIIFIITMIMITIIMIITITIRQCSTATLTSPAW